MAWMINQVTGEPMKVTPAQLKQIETKASTKDILKDVTKVASSTGGSLIIFLALFPFVLRHLMTSLPFLQTLVAAVSQAAKDPEDTANELGETIMDTLLEIPKGAYGAIAAQGFDLGAILTGGTQPHTPPEATPTGTVCERFEFDLVEIKRKLDKSSGLVKVQGTFAWIAKLYDMKGAGCSRPGFVSQDKWNKVPA
jgi:hypothetical protein